MLSPSQPGIPTFSFNSFSMFLSRASAVWLETLGPQWRLHNLLMGLSLGNLGQHHWKYQCTKMQLATIGYNWLDCPCYSHSCSCSSPGTNLVTFDSLSCCFFWATSLVSHTHTHILLESPFLSDCKLPSHHFSLVHAGHLTNHPRSNI